MYKLLKAMYKLLKSIFFTLLSLAGSLLLVEEDRDSTYAHHVLRCAIAEGAWAGHEVVAASLDRDPRHVLASAPSLRPPNKVGRIIIQLYDNKVLYNYTLIIINNNDAWQGQQNRREAS